MTSSTSRRVGVAGLFATSLVAAACSTDSSQESDPVYAAGAASGISTSDIADWNAAHAWGNHAAAGYLSDESDPSFAASPASGITAEQIAAWSSHDHDGDYLVTESDPSFAASPAASITAGQITAWSSHDHDARYFTEAEADARFVARSTADRYLQITATDFTPRNVSPDLDYLGGQGIRFGGTQTAWNLFAGVDLPDGATVKELRCYLRNNDTTEGFSDNSDIRLVRAAVPDYGDSFDTLNQIFMEVLPAAGMVERFVATQATLRIIDNANFQYFVDASLELTGTSSDMFDPMFRGCRITYTLP